MPRYKATVAMAITMTIRDMHIPSASMRLDFPCSTCRLQDMWRDQRISYSRYSSVTRSSHLVCTPKLSMDIERHLAKPQAIG